MHTHTTQRVRSEKLYLAEDNVKHLLVIFCPKTTLLGENPVGYGEALTPVQRPRVSVVTNCRVAGAAGEHAHAQGVVARAGYGGGRGGGSPVALATERLMTPIRAIFNRLEQTHASSAVPLTTR